MHVTVEKTCAFLLISLFLIGIFDTLGAIGYYYTSSDSWEFNNNCYLSFGHDINLTNVPKQGALYDATLVGYWAMNEDTGVTVNDDTGNGNNGSGLGTTILDGKYGNARYFDGNSAILVNDSQSLRLNSTDFSLSAVIKLDASGNGTIRTIVRKGNTGYNPFYCLRINAVNRVEFVIRDSPEPAHSYSLTSSIPFPLDEWVTITATFNNTKKLLALYINGTFNAQLYATDIGDVSSNKTLAIGKASEVLDQYFRGSIDEVRIYNRTLTANYVSALYSQPDPSSFANYVSFVDSITDNVMIVHVDNSTEDASDIITFVNCTRFFTGDKLTFQANSSATINIWTNLGRPTFNTGVWNSQNYTTTLTLSDSFTGEMNWNPSVPPSASNLSTTSTNVGNTTIFSAMWRDDRSLSGGGYIFSTNNTGQWVNASWVAFSSTPCWGNATLALNGNAGVVVGFREFANNSLGLWGDSGIYAITTTDDMSAPTSSSAPTPSPTPTLASTPTPTPTANPITTPTLQPVTYQYPQQTVAIAAVSIIVLVAASALAFKKGYISVQVVDEERGGIVEGEDEGSEEGSEKETQDYSI